MEESSGVKLITVYHVLNVLLIAAAGVMALQAWPQLPERMAIHFGADGTANGWAGKGFGVAMLAALPVFITAVMYGIMLLVPWMRRNPGLVNVPNKAKFLALSDEGREPIFALIKEMMAAMAVSANITFAAVNYGALQTAMGKLDRFPAAYVMPTLGLTFVVLIVYTVKMFKVMNRVTKGN